MRFKQQTPFRLLNFQIKFFNLFSSPGGSSQEFQTRFDTRITIKTSYVDHPSHFIPTVMLNKPGKDHLQGDAVKRVIRLLLIHGLACRVKKRSRELLKACLSFWLNDDGPPIISPPPRSSSIRLRMERRS